MTIDDVIRRIGEIGIVPVVRAAAVDEATRAVEAICAGGIPIVEITMTVPDAITVIRQVARQYGKDVLLGAGTVTTAHQAEQCIAAGAEFIVSPGLSFPVLAAAQACGKLAIPGALTPTELMNAQQNGAKLIKIFPCGNVGGPKISEIPKRSFPRRGAHSDRRSQRRQRRRVYCRWSLCPRRWCGVGQRRRTARRKSRQITNYARELIGADLSPRISSIDSVHFLALSFRAKSRNCALRPAQENKVRATPTD